MPRAEARLALALCVLVRGSQPGTGEFLAACTTRESDAIFPRLFTTLRQAESHVVSLTSAFAPWLFLGSVHCTFRPGRRGPLPRTPTGTLREVPESEMGLAEAIALFQVLSQWRAHFLPLAWWSKHCCVLEGATDRRSISLTQACPALHGTMSQRPPRSNCHGLQVLGREAALDVSATCYRLAVAELIGCGNFVGGSAQQAPTAKQ